MPKTNKTKNAIIALGKAIKTGTTGKVTVLKSSPTSPMQLYAGYISMAGPCSGGVFCVSFNDVGGFGIPASGGGGTVSLWPKWAYDAAVSALLNNRKVMILANGEALGTNLVEVLVSNQVV